MRHEPDDPSGDDPALDEASPLGDGTADVEGTVSCPYCGEANEVSLAAPAVLVAPRLR